jgi:putative RecB family exonuclease
MERQLEALWATIERALEREHFPPRPGPLCNWCSYKELCPAWASSDDASGREGTRRPAQPAIAG